ncbi:hypothetical protein Q7C36_005027 [Tachysurus vachellii]|uniref:Sushi domain-containing protein n=1 Tax=Tachysurus vachellii TaxID=175792 RepID=A0AA88NLC3_TACVA|nr:hypothetical protein Q7C36_005027 [Tachysurus vachellii]
MKIFILVFSVCSCLTVRGIKSCLSPSVPNAEPTNDLKLFYISGETVRFECNSGYGFEGTRYAVCDNGKWRLPVCKNASCTAPHVANAKPEKKLESSYASGHTVRFVCDRNYEFEETSYAVCDDGTWWLPVCKEKTWCIPPHVPNAQPTQELKESYPPDSTLRFQCNVAYEFKGISDVAVCKDGKWNLPECKRKRYSCDPPPRVDYGMIKQPYQDAFEHGQRLEYVCAKGYEPSGDKYSTCSNGKWTNTIKCEKITCPKPPQVQHTEAEELKNSYDIGETIRFRCRPSYEFDGSEIAECVDGSWRLPVCRPRRVSWCNQPRVQNGHHAGRLVSSYATGSSVKFVCDDGYEFEGTHYARCDKGQWTLPVCKQAVTGGHAVSDKKDPSLSGLDCGTRPLIENGDIIEQQGGNKLLVQCKVLYKRVGPEQVTCDSGVWTQLPVCKPPCKLDRTRFNSQYHPDVYLQEGETKTFYCPIGYYSYSITIRCTNGEAVYGHCH